MKQNPHLPHGACSGAENRAKNMTDTSISVYCRKPAGPPAAPEKQEKFPPGHGISRTDMCFVSAAVPESGQRNLDGLNLTLPKIVPKKQL